MNKLVYCYHCHTTRCGHAVGEDEEYVQAAIKIGIKRLGFSDHAMLPGYSQPGVRGDYSEFEGYVQSIRSLKEKYKDQIEISVGFEAEYYEDRVDYYKELLKTKKLDFLILGQHCTGKDGKFQWYFYTDCPINIVSKYIDDVIKGIETGLFSYVAHPDLFMYSQNGWNEELEQQARRLLKKCEEYNVPVEINIWGMRRPEWNGYSYGYPNERFFDLVKEYNVKVVLGMDAHTPEFFKQENVDTGFAFAKRHGLKVDKNFRI